MGFANNTNFGDFDDMAIDLKMMKVSKKTTAKL